MSSSITELNFCLKNLSNLKNARSHELFVLDFTLPLPYIFFPYYCWYHVIFIDSSVFEEGRRNHHQQCKHKQQGSNKMHKNDNILCAGGYISTVFFILSSEISSTRFWPKIASMKMTRDPFIPNDIFPQPGQNFANSFASSYDKWPILIIPNKMSPP